ncbi:hypothetical protein TPHA_0B03360 [Tetrapisispora phaffii CBS 4417]|uniref:U5 small nuclear ribonucleoprotein 200 kDa helicase n=1 Tax=Tetrapisispora phaffii (strain ATCC 24235 / CBS 4417 / NBRC 1672 / NRRL Y-8282 / UCD 70-5) TaxID=1071381 RepID=G8BPS6_TETPH|nr:hypothetical protein TPHA_0B03360 [Tetrapisispora phaffii CBS 4417]CCE62007.1 hypothetical protein TPHA_0B03360 [Tetrapisispora phaffii CBS 4417]
MESEREMDRKRIKEIYRSDEMSNLVLTSNKQSKSGEKNNIKEAEASQPKSVAGVISKNDMGSAMKHDLETSSLKDELSLNIQTYPGDAANKKEDLQPKNTSNRYGNTLLDLDELTEIKYHPTNDTTFLIYEEILQWVISIIGNDIPHQVIIETTDLLISLFKEDEENTHDTQMKLTKIEEILQMPINKLNFQSLMKLMNNITDYSTQKYESSNTKTGNAIAVVSSEDEDDTQDQPELDFQEHHTNIDTKFITKKDIGRNETTDSHVLNSSKSNIILGTTNYKIFSDTKIYDVNPNYLYNIIFSSNLKNPHKATMPNFENIIELLSSEHLTASALSKSLKAHKIDISDELIDNMILNKDKLKWGLLLSKSNDSDKDKIIEEMKNNNLLPLIDEYLNYFTGKVKRKLEPSNQTGYNDSDDDTFTPKRAKTLSKSLQYLNLEEFQKYNRISDVSANKIVLPNGSFKRVKPKYEEIHIPPLKQVLLDYTLINITDLPKWAQSAFPPNEIEVLNAIQSKVYGAAFETDENMLVCAPTGAGKTNIALLAILRCISKHFSTSKETLQLNNFKIVFIAPLKALVQEQVREFQRRLSPYGIKVSELTGDSNLSRSQINETQILVSTPEKWDIITRKSNDLTYVNLVDLVIIDEVHLLHDPRGPVIESIVSRSLIDANIKNPRIMAMSATLPNYKDVAKFLRVKEPYLFYFDSTFRPCPLSQQFCGITEKSSIKKISAMNEVCYDKVLESVTEGHQVIVFVHSRKDTHRTAEYLKKEFLKNHLLDKIKKPDAGSKEILRKETETIKNSKLKDLCTFGIGIHHAGLDRSDRSLSEDLFADGLLQVLVSTATLAWGVNLPAHTVIIKGTEVYSPETSKWEKLSAQDVLQMLGRAGRPRYDTHGKGIIITNQTDIKYYLAVLTNQLSIQSYLSEKLVDCLNAEIVLGNVININDAKNWFQHTFLYIRMLVSPKTYNIPNLENFDSFMFSLMHTCFRILHDGKLVVYNDKELTVESTELGKIASHYYIDHESIKLYYDNINSNMDTSELLQTFSLSSEFKFVSVRTEERKELMTLKSRSPFPIPESMDENSTKIIILLQSYISRIQFEGLALNADMTFIIQNAGRLMKAIYEICLYKNYARQTKTAISLCKCIDNRMWSANSPLRQFKGCPNEVIKRTEASYTQWDDYLKIQSPSEVGKAIRSEKNGKLIYDLLRRFPKVQLECQVQTITPTIFLFDLTFTPTWIWDSRYHKTSEPFIIIVEDSDGKEILYSNYILINKNELGQDHMLSFTLELPKNNNSQVPPNIFINIISEKWIKSSETLSVSLAKLIKPRKFTAPMKANDIELVFTSRLQVPEFSNVFNFDKFDFHISSCFDVLYNSNDNIFISRTENPQDSTGPELALLNHWRQNKGRAIYIHPSQTHIDHLVNVWQGKFSKIAEGQVIQKLTEDVSINIKLLAQSHLILGTPEQLNFLSRKWPTRKNLQLVELLIYDGLQNVRNSITGSVYEILISRMNLMIAQLEKDIRIVGFSSPIANSRDFADFIGVNKKFMYNFSPQDRIEQLNVEFITHNNMGFKTPSNLSRRQAFDYILYNGKPRNYSIIYTQSRKECYKVARQFVSYLSYQNTQSIDKPNVSSDEGIKHISDPSTKSALDAGIGIIYEGMPIANLDTILKLYNDGNISTLLIPFESVKIAPKSNITIILDTEYYDEQHRCYYDCNIDNVNEMISHTVGNTDTHMGIVLIFTNSYRKEYYQKFITEPVPVESSLLNNIHDYILNEICTSIIENKQDCMDLLTYSLFYRRLHANPSYYGLSDVSAEGISQFLTTLVNDVIADLINCSLISPVSRPDADTINEDRDEEGINNDENFIILPFSNVLVKYNISFYTMKYFLNNLTSASTLKDILLLLSNSREFDTVPLREGDLSYLQNLEKRLPLKFTGNIHNDPRKFKLFILFQSYFSRISLSTELKNDLHAVLKHVCNLTATVVDILAGNGWLNSTTAMDLLQMFVQGVWDTDNSLKQIPLFDKDILSKCAVKGVDSVYDFMALEDEDREEILSIDNIELNKIANFVNNYPNIELKYQIENINRIEMNSIKEIMVTISRDEEPESTLVISEKYPYDKIENWWLVLGECDTRELYAIRKVTLSKESQSFKLPFSLDRQGTHKLTLFCVCDSYLDADKEVSFDVTVA